MNFTITEMDPLDLNASNDRPKLCPSDLCSVSWGPHWMDWMVSTGKYTEESVDLVKWTIFGGTLRIL